MTKSVNFSPERLAAAREASRDGEGMTQVEAADAAGISRATLQNAEGGKRLLRADALARLAAVYGVSLDSLFIHGEEGDTPPIGRGSTNGDRTAAGKRSPAPARNGE